MRNFRLMIKMDDLKEIELFQEFLNDLNSQMDPTVFAQKWYQYMQTTKDDAAHYKLGLRPVIVDYIRPGRQK